MSDIISIEVALIAMGLAPLLFLLIKSTKERREVLSLALSSASGFYLWSLVIDLFTIERVGFSFFHPKPTLFMNRYGNNA